MYDGEGVSIASLQRLFESLISISRLGVFLYKTGGLEIILVTVLSHMLA
jgi:hypothetical protein